MIGEDVSWEYLFELAGHHRVQNLLYRGLSSLPSQQVPSDVQRQVQSAARGTLLKNRFLLGEMGRVQSLFADEGVSSLAFKGPILAYLVYQDARCRSAGDIDILVQADDFDKARRLLIQDEYEPVQPRHDLLPTHSSYLERQTALVRGNSFVIDLHTSTTPIVYASGADFHQLLDRSVKTEISDVKVRTLADVDRLLMLCQQGVKNRWNRLKYVCDVAEFVVSRNGFEWGGVLREARRTAQERQLLTNLYIAREILGIPLPAVLSSAVEQETEARQIGTWAVQKLERGLESIGVSFSERIWLYWTVQDSLFYALHYAFFSVVRKILSAYDVSMEAIGAWISSGREKAADD